MQLKRPWPRIPELALQNLGPSTEGTNFTTAIIFKSVLGPKLGQGRFGVVFKATNPHYRLQNDAIAIKIISDPAGSAEAREAFILRPALQAQRKQWNSNTIRALKVFSFFCLM
jgi:hypothetical protein